LRDTEQAMYRSLVARNSEAVAAPIVAQIVADGLSPQSRLSIHRNNFIGALTTALRASFPAVHRLVGGAFFDGAARTFIEESTPGGAYLNEYGADFPAFLAQLPQSAALVYLAGVARLEWAVNSALHAPDAEPLALSDLAAIDPTDHARIVFAPHPSVSVVHAEHPIDEIWRSVLAADDVAMAAIALDPVPIRLLVQRTGLDVQIARISPDEADFFELLCAGRSLEEALVRFPHLDVPAVLAGHLATGRFAGFDLIDDK
ncbi:MAG: HvfC/BufC family peptide modification chaperone, partial [Acetobacteraceae bacterium]